MQAPRVEGVSMLHTIGGVYDWYASAHGWRGIAGTGAGLDVIVSAAGADPLGLNAFWDITTHSAIILFLVRPAGGGSRSFAMSPDVVGHEFTHGVLAAPLAQGGLCELEYSNDWTWQSQSVSEGLCDTMGNLHSDALDPDWKLGEHDIIDDDGKAHWLRNDSDPHDAEAMTWGDREYNAKASCTQRFCNQYPPPQGHEKDCPVAFDSYDTSYVCATLIPHPAWKMTRALGAEKVGRIYFHVIDRYLGQKAKLTEVSQFVFDACNDLHPGDAATCCTVHDALVASRFAINPRALPCGPADGGTPSDAGVDGSVPVDAGKDAGAPDAGAVDAGSPDAAGPDAGVADAGVVDAGQKTVACGQYASPAGYQGRPCASEGEHCDRLLPACDGTREVTCDCTDGLWACPEVACPDAGGDPGDAGATTDDAAGADDAGTDDAGAPGVDAAAGAADAGDGAGGGEGGCACATVSL
jgi:hypothetical protein